mmetsp:Transcript_2429/g.5358  ORF Transcript_2429/g.5358 Transcript_2429/m.5358 type:complete len:206 (+) Transcript_2429:153-770(+)
MNAAVKTASRLGCTGESLDLSLNAMIAMGLEFVLRSRLVFRSCQIVAKSMGSCSWLYIKSQPTTTSKLSGCFSKNTSWFACPHNRTSHDTSTHRVLRALVAMFVSSFMTRSTLRRLASTASGFPSVITTTPFICASGLCLPAIPTATPIPAPPSPAPSSSTRVALARATEGCTKAPSLSSSSPFPRSFSCVEKSTRSKPSDAPRQ